MHTKNNYSLVLVKCSHNMLQCCTQLACQFSVRQVCRMHVAYNGQPLASKLFSHTCRTSIYLLELKRVFLLTS